MNRNTHDPVAQLAQNTVYLSAQEQERLLREQRQADALAYLRRKGHDDLAEVLGLVPAARKGRRR
jgi:hypothetical protein